MDELVRMLRDSLPNVPLLMTTPPGSYDSFRKSRRRRTYSINPRTAIAVETMRRFADDNGLAGGRETAWLSELAGSKIDASGPCTLSSRRICAAR